ncbi:MAG: thiamine diphosphokinase [Actinobacteria bacterium]|nr:thiamine diphosphokinase [Actinomycetota bacterium]MBA3561333.1 thiamine diphosphokinase [Actinomycetota bacterium]MBA3566355.1 thiamine diphosphokinase [Actinomycetota bacterium]MDQ3085822.1 thiamine diphosphokinase [Actinomycetota bacterium]
MSEELVVVVAGGEAPQREALPAIPSGTPVVAADSGLEHARELGLEVTIAVGDFDSASPEAVAAAEASGTRIERHSTEKDATDLELALDAALELRPRRVVVLAGIGDRLDHLFSAFLLIASPRYAGVELDAHIGRARAHVIRGERTLSGQPGELLSLFALHGSAVGVRTDGLAYPLDGETLEPGSSRGVSNVFASARATIAVKRGVLVAIRPGTAR